jgi:hypothetical protein
MDDFTKEAVDCFVEAMYSGGADKLEKEIFEDVNKMAHVFNVSWLSKRCFQFYKTDVLNFDSSSYDEILFACEIASRAHYNLKQTRFVSCFVENMTFGKLGKMIFLQRYMANFAELSKRQIDMSLAVAKDDSNLIMNVLTFHLTSLWKSGKLDENSVYLLQKFDVGKFRRNFPGYYDDVANFLGDFAENSQANEVKEIVKNFLDTKSDMKSDDLHEANVDVELGTNSKDDDEYDCEDLANTAIQTEELVEGNCSS